VTSQSKREQKLFSSAESCSLQLKAISTSIEKSVQQNDSMDSNIALVTLVEHLFEAMLDEKGVDDASHYD
jgi:hypothetical protein